MITLNHLRILQWVRTLTAGCFSLNAAGIVLLIFAPSHAQSAPRNDFQAPISSSECRERLRIFGASDAGIELANPAIEGYVKARSTTANAQRGLCGHLSIPDVAAGIERSDSISESN